MQQKYSLAQRIIHWLSAFLLAAAVVLGFMLEEMGEWALNAHVVAGVSVLALTCFRIILHWRIKRPEYPPHIDAFSIKAAKLAQYAMLSLLLAQPVLGLVIYNLPHTVETKTEYTSDGRQVIEREIEYNSEAGETLAEAHEAIAMILLMLIALHVAGFFKHLLIGRTNLLTRIT